MRLKDPFSLKAAEMTKRTNKPRKPRDEESSDEVSGKLNLAPSRGVSLVELLKIHTFFPQRESAFDYFLWIEHFIGLVGSLTTSFIHQFPKSDLIVTLNSILQSGLTCQHVGKAVDLTSVKKAVLSSVWLVCSDCLKERTMIDTDIGTSHDIVVCLKCGFQVNIKILLYISHTRASEITICSAPIWHGTCILNLIECQQQQILLFSFCISFFPPLW